MTALPTRQNDVGNRDKAYRLLRDPTSTLHFAMLVVTQTGLCPVSNDLSILTNSTNADDYA